VHINLTGNRWRER